MPFIPIIMLLVAANNLILVKHLIEHRKTK